VEAWDRNCRQHIPRLVPAAEDGEVEALRQRVAALEAELGRLRAGPA
jgi:hypothetical protein